MSYTGILTLTMINHIECKLRNGLHKTQVQNVPAFRDKYFVNFNYEGEDLLFIKGGLRLPLYNPDLLDVDFGLKSTVIRYFKYVNAVLKSEELIVKLLAEQKKSEYC
jgi:stress response protein YsnF